MQVFLIGGSILVGLIVGLIVGTYFTFMVFKKTIFSITENIAESLVEEMDKHYKRKF